MPRKRHKPEEIVTKLRQVDVLVSQGQDSRNRPCCGHTTQTTKKARRLMPVPQA